MMKRLFLVLMVALLLVGCSAPFMSKSSKNKEADVYIAKASIPEIKVDKFEEKILGAYGILFYDSDVSDELSKSNEVRREGKFLLDKFGDDMPITISTVSNTKAGTLVKTGVSVFLMSVKSSQLEEVRAEYKRFVKSLLLMLCPDTEEASIDEIIKLMEIERPEQFDKYRYFVFDNAYLVQSSPNVLSLNFCGENSYMIDSIISGR